MSDLLAKCDVCLALLDEEDLFCANCGREAEQRDGAPKDRTRQTTDNFRCEGCGASMSYDASAKTLRCPFCGSERLAKQTDRTVLAPERVVAFSVSRDRAEAELQRWLGKGFWRPNDLQAKAALVVMTPVYLPYWVFCAKTFTYWTADTDRVPIGASGNWRPLFGEHRGEYAGLLVGGSSVLTPTETAAIAPFDLANALPPESIDLDNLTVEQFAVARKYARPLARVGLEALEQVACTALVPGRSRNVKVNVRIEGLASEPVLLPAWIMAYRYGDRVFRFLLNGQTGRAAGQAPVSKFKIVAVIAVAATILAIVLLVGGLL